MHKFCIHRNCLLANIVIKSRNKGTSKLRIFIFATLVQIFEGSLLVRQSDESIGLHCSMQWVHPDSC